MNRLCASGMSAVVQAGRAIAAGHGDLFIAGGVEHMTRGPWVMSKTSTPYGRDAQLFDSSFGWRFVNPRMEEKLRHRWHGPDRREPAGGTGHQPGGPGPLRPVEPAEGGEGKESGRLARETFLCPFRSEGRPVPFSEDEFIKRAAAWRCWRSCVPPSAGTAA